MYNIILYNIFTKCRSAMYIIIVLVLAYNCPSFRKLQLFEYKFCIYIGAPLLIVLITAY